MRYDDLPKMTRNPGYRINLTWFDLEGWIARQAKRDLDLNPDFQRAHVWSELQQVRYIEFMLRGGNSGKDLYFNHPNWSRGGSGVFVLVDGKQRLNAVLRFLHNEIPAFECYYRDWEGLPVMDLQFIININDLKSREEVLQWYIDINAGGIAHTEAEIAKVREMLEEELSLEFKKVR